MDHNQAKWGRLCVICDTYHLRSMGRVADWPVARLSTVCGVVVSMELRLSCSTMVGAAHTGHNTQINRNRTVAFGCMLSMIGCCGSLVSRVVIDSLFTVGHMICSQRKLESGNT